MANQASDNPKSAPSLSSNILGTRLFLRTITAVLLALAATLVLEFAISSSRNIEASRQDLIRRIDAIEPNIVQALWRIDPETIRVAVQSIGANPGVATVSLRAQFRINDINELYVRPGAENLACSDRIIRDYSDMEYQGLRISSGVLSVCFSPSLIERPNPFAPVWSSLVRTVGVATLVAAILFSIIRRSVLSPIDQITTRIRTNTLAASKPLQRDTWDKGDELDVLSAELAHATILAERNHIDDKLRSLGLLASGVAHDMNNVLGVALGHAELLRISPGDPNKVVERADTVINAIKNASTVVGRLMFLSAANKGTKTLVELPSFMATMKSFSKFLLQPFTTIEFANHSQSGLYLDLGGLQAALINLILNASDELADRNNGKIVVTARDVIVNNALQVCIEVADNGRGMAEDVLKRATEPFYTTKPKGSGLGLTMVAEYVASMEGHLEITSREGEGTTVKLSFPAVSRTPEPAQAFSDQSPDKKPAPQRRARVLIIDDNMDYAKLLKALVEQLGHDALCITDPRAAMAFMERHADIDVIISDILLGEVDGPELYAKMKGVLGDRCPPVIFISGARTDPGQRLATSVDDACVLTKPFELCDLEKRIQASIGGSNGAS